MSDALFPLAAAANRLWDLFARSQLQIAWAGLGILRRLCNEKGREILLKGADKKKRKPPLGENEFRKASWSISQFFSGKLAAK